MRAEKAKRATKKTDQSARPEVLSIPAAAKELGVSQRKLESLVRICAITTVKLEGIGIPRCEMDRAREWVHQPNGGARESFRRHLRTLKPRRPPSGPLPRTIEDCMKDAVASEMRALGERIDAAMAVKTRYYPPGGFPRKPTRSR